MLINPNVVEAKGIITASSEKYLSINCHVGPAAGVEEVEIGMKNSPGKNPKGRSAAPDIANRDNRLFWGSAVGGNDLLISQYP